MNLKDILLTILSIVILVIGIVGSIIFFALKPIDINYLGLLGGIFGSIIISTTIIILANN